MLAVVIAAIGLGVWMGVRKYRELGQVARDASTGQNEQELARLRSEVTSPPVRVRPVFRLLGFIAGPLMLLGGLLFIGISLSSLFEDGVRTWWLSNHGFVLAGIVCMLIGILITRAAITGQDRYIFGDTLQLDAAA
jgi:hypothetical protein